MADVLHPVTIDGDDSRDSVDVSVDIASDDHVVDQRGCASRRVLLDTVEDRSGVLVQCHEVLVGIQQGQA